MRIKHYILLGLVGLIIILVLAINYFPWSGKIQTSEKPEEFSLFEEDSKETQENEAQLIMDEIDSILNDFSGLADSINELDENEDLSGIFQGN